MRERRDAFEQRKRLYASGGPSREQAAIDDPTQFKGYGSSSMGSGGYSGGGGYSSSIPGGSSGYSGSSIPGGYSGASSKYEGFGSETNNGGGSSLGQAS